MASLMEQKITPACRVKPWYRSPYSTCTRRRFVSNARHLYYSNNHNHKNNNTNNNDNSKKNNHHNSNNHMPLPAPSGRWCRCSRCQRRRPPRRLSGAATSAACVQETRAVNGESSVSSQDSDKSRQLYTTACKNNFCWQNMNAACRDEALCFPLSLLHLWASIWRMTCHLYGPQWPSQQLDSCLLLCQRDA